MATGGNSEPAETLDCPVCLQQFHKPRILSCLHTVCEKCLDIRIMSQEEGRCVCPLCHVQIVPLDPTLVKAKWASAFPLNELIHCLIESQNKSYNNDNYCMPCKGEKQLAAEFWCVTCEERLCGPCNSYHKRLKQMKDHEIVSIYEMEHVQSNLIIDQNCIKHPGNKLDTFCVKHRALCCGVCFAISHRDCGDIRDVQSAADDQANRCNYRNFIKEISEIKTEINKILANMMNNCSQITENDQIIHNMEIRKQIKCFLTNIVNTEHILESLEKKASTREKLITFEILLSQIASHYEQLKLTTRDDVGTHFSLKSDDALHGIEQRMGSLGAVQTSSKQPKSFKDALKNVDHFMKNLFSISKLSTALSAAQIAKCDIMTSQVTFVKAVTAQTYGSRSYSTWFTGGTVLPDGRLLIADYNNSRLVQLDEDYNMVNEYKIDRDPTDVAAGHANNEIYIVVYQGYLGIYLGQGYVYKCTLGECLKVVNEIKAPLTARGIAVIDDNIIVGTYDAVVILNQDGTTMKSIPTPRGPCYVAVSQTQRTLYHRENDDIVCRTLEGNELFRYQHEQLKEPRGICTDKNGCAFICGLNSNNVHQVWPDGKRSRILVNKLQTISKPLCGVFLSRQNQLVVTSYKENTVLEVYKLK